MQVYPAQYGVWGTQGCPCIWVHSFTTSGVMVILFVAGGQAREEEKEDWQGKKAHAVQQAFCQCGSHLRQEEGTQCQLLSCHRESIKV